MITKFPWRQGAFLTAFVIVHCLVAINIYFLAKDTTPY